MRTLIITLFSLLLFPGFARAQTPESFDIVRRKVSKAIAGATAEIRVSQAMERATTDKPAGTSKPTRTRLTVLVTGGIRGEFAEPHCRSDAEPTDDDFAFARQAAYVRTVDTLHARAPELPPPVLIDVGDTIFPGVLGRYLLSRGESGAINLVSLLTEIPYDVQAVGNMEFSVPRMSFVDYANAAQKVRLGLGAANAVCNATGGAEALCEAFGTHPGGDPVAIIERGGVRIALLSVIDPAVRDRVAEGNLAGLDILEPEAVLERHVAAIRGEDRADVVFVTYHGVRDSIVGAERIASSLDGIDAVFTGELFDSPRLDESAESAPRGHIEATRTGTPIVDGASGPDAVVAVDMEIFRGDEEARVVDVRPRTVSVEEMPGDREAGAILGDIHEALCSEWGVGIADVGLSRSFDADTMKRYVLDVMRFSTRSEIALFNAGGFRNLDDFPVDDTLTKVDVHGAVPFGNRIVTVELTGERLTELSSMFGDRLVTAGVEVQNGSVFVNGRPVDVDRSYTVATNAFLAFGGDGIFDPTQLEPETFTPDWNDEAPTVAQTVIHWIESGAWEERGDEGAGLSPAGDFPDLHRKLMWTFAGAVTASYDEVAVENPDDAYQQSQLTAASTTQIGGEGQFEADAEGRNHGVDNSILLQYARASVAGADATVVEETKDVIRLSSTYKWLYPRSELEGPIGSRLAPIPYVEGEVESEFTRPEERDYHRLQATGMIGLRFRLLAPLELKVAADARRELLDPEAGTTVGVVAGYELKRVDLFRIFGRPIQVESSLEYLHNDFAAENIQELRNDNDLYFALFDRFFFNASASFFAYRTVTGGSFGTNREVMIGLNYRWDRSVQTF